MTRGQRRVLEAVKRLGPATVNDVANALDLTGAAVRQHLAELEAEGLVESQAAQSDGRGRPPRRWTVTARAHPMFPDHHGELTVELLDAIRRALGPAGVDRVLEERRRHQAEVYGRAVPVGVSIGKRVKALAKQRAAEGYMAEAVPDANGSWLLVEHHCPICEAASSCQGLCRGELELFRDTIGPDTTVEREEHLLSGGTRCVYRVSPVATAR